MPSKTGIFVQKRAKFLTIRILSQNCLKVRIFTFLRARESLTENTSIFQWIFVKIFQRLFNDFPEIILRYNFLYFSSLASIYLSSNLMTSLLFLALPIYSFDVLSTM